MRGAVLVMLIGCGGGVEPVSSGNGDPPVSSPATDPIMIGPIDYGSAGGAIDRRLPICPHDGDVCGAVGEVFCVIGNNNNLVCQQGQSVDHWSLEQRAPDFVCPAWCRPE